MNQLILLIPFAIALLTSVVSKKISYISLIISSLILGVYAIIYTGINELTFFYLIASIVIIVSSWYSIRYDKKYRWLAPLFASAVFGIIIILLSYNSLQFLAGWELMSISGYLMIGLNKNKANPAFIFSAFSELSTVLLIAGMAYAYVLTGTFNFVLIPSIMPLILMSVGFFIKMGIVPFMIADWLPIAHRNAPSNASAIFSALMTLMGVFGLIKFTLLSPGSISLGVVLMGIGAFSVFFAALFEYVSESTKLLLGYSTIENNGAILVAVGLLITNLSGIMDVFIIYTILMLSLAHSISKTGLFLMSGSLDSEDMDTINNSKDPTSTLGNILVSASLSGLLPTIGGVAIWMLLETLFITATISSWIAIPALIIGSLIALGEGIVSGAMIKFISFTQLFRNGKAKKPTNIYPILFAGILVFALGLGSVLIINPAFITGLIKVGIPNGLLIQSLTSSKTTFGAIAPIFIAIFISIFTLLALVFFRKPKIRRSPVWNNGIEDMAGYTSFAFANNMRIMMGKILQTNTDTSSKDNATRNIFWDLIVKYAKLYQNIARSLTWNIMNSSIRSYVSYLVIAFIFVIVFVTLTN
jgi:formate hydrogenlyase subunit 3/multisubunit Na+/H+ antiporter MnhD subunit